MMMVMVVYTLVVYPGIIGGLAVSLQAVIDKQSEEPAA